ncbi:MAG: class I tRNA ligase family protein, partial [bacterium]|nr:class I tRNA ligase family protein [bacterium]
YWGEPIPLVHCEVDGTVSIPEDQLPVVLPEVEKYEPTGTGESPLAAIDEWVTTTCPKCGGPAKRETNTMPQWAGSSWYYLRYTDSKNDQAFAAPDKLKYWLPVDTYFGGMEHTTLHLLYSRFWNIFLYDQGLVPVSEPYTKRVPHGIVLAADGSKMSKSKGNVVNPDELVSTHGADTIRMYELFLGPHGASVSWSDKGIVGVARFLDRVWYWVHNAERVETDNEYVERALHALIKKITEDIEGISYNTAVSSFMEFHNSIKDQSVSVEVMKTFVRLLYPFVPHIAEELHEVLGGEDSAQNQPWPKFDESKLVVSTVKIVVQVNGKVKDTIEIPVSATEEEIKHAAMSSEKIISILAGTEPKRVIIVVNKLVNIVI